MPNIAEIKDIIRMTPTSQPVLLTGGHGIGKSQVLEQILCAKFVPQLDKDGNVVLDENNNPVLVRDESDNLGYDRLITLFLGQAADAGDIIGLPTRIPVTINGEETFVTDFAPPKWWPRDMNEKPVIFLDELNRGKPEIMQCVMDMVLNRKLNGRSLPPGTKIIAAMNPLDDGYYQVEELDPAFLDRWNVYQFTPSHEEWLDWGFQNKVNPAVRSFIATHNDHLDPPSSKEAKAGDVQPSRRSWVRISDIINRNPELVKDQKKLKELQTTIIGIIGNRSAAQFCKHVREVAHSMTPEQILTKWQQDSKIPAAVGAMQVQDMMQMNSNLERYISEHFSELKKSKDACAIVAKNLQYYLETISPEVAADFFDRFSRANTKKEQWPPMIISSNKDMAKKFVRVMRGEDIDKA